MCAVEPGCPWRNGACPDHSREYPDEAAVAARLRLEARLGQRIAADLATLPPVAEPVRSVKGVVHLAAVRDFEVKTRATWYRRAAGEWLCRYVWDQKLGRASVRAPRARPTCGACIEAARLHGVTAWLVVSDRFGWHGVPVAAGDLAQSPARTFARDRVGVAGASATTGTPPAIPMRPGRGSP